jgi:hypothetical protein
VDEMNNRLSVKVCSVLATVVVLTGCQQKQREETVVLDREPNFAEIRIPLGYEAQAFETTGGLNLWKQKARMQLDCVVTFYQPDGSFYLTQQQYIVYPWSNSIEIFGREPLGDFAWRLSQGRFDVLRGSRQVTNMISPFDNQCFAEAILNIITAPVRLLDHSVEFTREANPVRIEGQWYYPIDRRRKSDIESLLRIPKAVFYQNRDTSIIDTLSIACLGADRFLTVRGYDYSPLEEKDIVIPHRMDLFIADSEGYPQKRLAQIDIQ